MVSPYIVDSLVSLNATATGCSRQVITSRRMEKGGGRGEDLSSSRGRQQQVARLNQWPEFASDNFLHSRSPALPLTSEHISRLCEKTHFLLCKFTRQTGEGLKAFFDAKREKERLRVVCEAMQIGSNQKGKGGGGVGRGGREGGSANACVA